MGSRSRKRKAMARLAKLSPLERYMETSEYRAAKDRRVIAKEGVRPQWVYDRESSSTQYIGGDKLASRKVSKADIRRSKRYFKENPKAPRNASHNTSRRNRTATVVTEDIVTGVVEERTYNARHAADDYGHMSSGRAGHDPTPEQWKTLVGEAKYWAREESVKNRPGPVPGPHDHRAGHTGECTHNGVCVRSSLPTWAQETPHESDAVRIDPVGRDVKPTPERLIQVKESRKREYVRGKGASMPTHNRDARGNIVHAPIDWR